MSSLIKQVSMETELSHQFFFGSREHVMRVAVKIIIESLSSLLIYYSGASDNGHSEEWTTSLQWTHCSHPLPIIVHTFLPPKKGQQQLAKCLSPMCPLFRGSTVYTFQQELRVESTVADWLLGLVWTKPRFGHHVGLSLGLRQEIHK